MSDFSDFIEDMELILIELPILGEISLGLHVADMKFLSG